MSKLNKFLRNPFIYFRDYLLKKYPPLYGGYKVEPNDSLNAAQYESKLLKFVDIEEDIDVVYTWVNNDDDEWYQKKEYHKQLLKNNRSNLFIESTIDNRFNNHNEIYYSIKTLRKYIPWVRKIFIVTDNQTPQLDSYSDVVIVDHKEIIDNKYLPTFNSHVIEANIHKIPNLSDNFIYFNDDIFIARKIQKSHFFRRNGLCSLFLTHRSLKQQLANGIMTPTLQASLNSNAIIKKYFNIDFIDAPLVHTYVPLNRKVFEFCYNEFNAQISDFLGNKFRGKNDINMATFLVPWVTYLKQLSFENVDVCYYMNMNSNSFKSDIEALIKVIGTDMAPHSFCINDVGAQNIIDNDLIKKYLYNIVY